MPYTTIQGVKQPLTWSGVPRSEGGTVTGAPGTALYSDPIYIGDCETVSLVIAISEVTATVHCKIDYQISFDYSPTTGDLTSGTWHGNTAADGTETAVTADLTGADDTDTPYALSPTLAPYIRFMFTGATSNGAYNRIRGAVYKQ